MRFSRFIAASALCAVVGSAQAVNTPGHDIPYVAGFGTYTIVDNDRTWDDDFGYQITFGLPLNFLEDTALEFSFFNAGFERDIDGEDDYHAGITLDLVRDFGGISFLSRADMKPYALAGIGAVRDDVQGETKTRPMANIGGGALFQLPYWGMGLRTEFRLVGQHQSLSAPGSNLLLDYRFLVGLQIPLTPFFGERAPDTPLPVEEECEVAVVDPITGRTDCRREADEAPAEERKPSREAAKADSDGDGVPDSRDECPDTYVGVTVNTRGCAEPQPLVIPRLTFDFDTARLTSNSRGELSDVAAMLKGQPGLTVEIIGHTDSMGPDDYNQRLSKRRAQAVKDYLVSLNIDASRLETAGRGSSQPVASNETEEGRDANRRVTFWLYLD